MHLYLSFNRVSRPRRKNFRNLWCTGKKEGRIERVGLVSLLILLLVALLFVILYTNTETKMSGASKCHW